MPSFGGVIKLGGVAEYKMALANVSQQLRETGSALKAIAADFAASDHSEQAQMYTLKQLNNVLQQQKDAYNKLQTTYTNMRNVYAQNESYLSRLNIQYVTEKAKLEQVGKTLGTTSSAYKTQENAVAKLKQSISNATLTQESNATQLSKVRTKLNEAKLAYDETSLKIKNFSNSINNSNETAKKASSGGYTVLKNTVANVLTGAFQRLTSLIAGQFSSAIKRTDDIRAFGITLKNLGYTEDEVTQTTNKLLSGIQGLPTSLSEITTVQKQFVALSGNLEEATNLTLALNNATIAGGQGQAVANSALTQWYQIIANGKPDMQSWRIINQAMPAQLNQIAESIMGVGHKSGDLYTAWQKGIVTTEQVTGALVKLNNEGTGSVASFSQQALGASGGILASFSNMKLAITGGLSEMIKIIGDDKISSALDSLKNAIKGAFEVAGNALRFILEHGNEIAVILIAIGAALVPLLIVTKIGQAVKALTEAMAAIKPIISILKGSFASFNAILAANPILIVVAAVAALVAAFIYLWNNCEEFRNFFINLWQNIQNAVSVAVEAIKNFFLGMWNFIVNVFSGFIGFFKGIWDGIVAIFSGIAQWFGGIFSSAWDGITAAFSSVGSFFSGVWSGITNIFSAVGSWFKNVFSGAWKGITDAFSAVGNFFKSIWEKITSPFKGVIDWFKEKFIGARNGVTEPFNAIGDFFKNVWDGICAPFRKAWEMFCGIGGNLIKGLWDGISNSFDWIKNKIAEWVGNVFNFIKKLFGIASPSKLFRDEIGANLALGIGEGFSDEMKNVQSQMEDALPTNFDVEANLNNKNKTLNGADATNLTYFDAVNAFKDALSDMNIELDNENMGRFVRKTVTKAIYA